MNSRSTTSKDSHHLITKFTLTWSAFSKLIFSICVPRLLNSASRAELEHNSRLAQRSRAALAELYDELIDRDSIHTLPAECFGTSSSLKQAKLCTTPGLEAAEDDLTHADRVCTSLMFLITGETTACGEGAGSAISSVPALEPPADCGFHNAHDTSSGNNLDIDTCRQPPSMDQGEAGNENEPDPFSNFLSDTFWTTGDTGGYEDIPSSFPDLSTGVPSASTPDTNVLTPSTIPNTDVLLSTNSGEFMKH